MREGGNAGASASERAEVTEVHTRILRLALGIDDSRAYWSHVDPTVPRALRAERAFEERWFGAKSMSRVRFLLAAFADRFDVYPEGLAVLRGARSLDAATRQVICHWHLQLSDPMYRAFSGTFLPERRERSSTGGVDRDIVGRWIEQEYGGRWSASTCVQFASKLMSAAFEAGLVSRPPDPRSLQYPRVTDAALGYLLYLLRTVRFQGTMIDNPYLRSVGLTSQTLAHRLNSLPGVTYHRVADVAEIEWASPDLASWAEAAL